MSKEQDGIKPLIISYEERLHFYWNRYPAAHKGTGQL